MRAWAYTEGEDLRAGKVRAVHLHEVLALEEQYTMSGNVVTRSIRAHWLAKADPPRLGQMLSLHIPGQRVLVSVSRVSTSCGCCPRGAVCLVYMREVRTAMRIRKECRCCETPQWAQVDEWVSPTNPRELAASDGAHVRREMTGILELFNKRRK